MSKSRLKAEEMQILRLEAEEPRN